MDNLDNKLGADAKTMYEEEVFNTLMTLAVPEIMDTIEEEDNLSLNGVLAHKNSIARTELYQGLFMERLEEFEFLEVTDGNITLNIPDIETMDFSGDLRILHTILEGVSPSTYLEVNENNRRKMGLAKANLSYRIKGKTIYLYNLKRHKTLETKMRESKIERVEYPFSRMGPIDIFVKANEVVDEYLSAWLDTAIKEGSVKFTKKYKGKTV